MGQLALPALLALAAAGLDLIHDLFHHRRHLAVADDDLGSRQGSARTMARRSSLRASLCSRLCLFLLRRASNWSAMLIPHRVAEGKIGTSHAIADDTCIGAMPGH